MLSAIKNSKGQTLVILVASMIALLGAAALALDLGVAYGVKAKLNGAVDAACIAGGRAVQTGADNAIRQQNAVNAANQFFMANFPGNYLAATNILVSPSAVFNSTSGSADYGTWKVTVTATANTPTYFGRIFGKNLTQVGVLAETTVRTVDMVFVMDCSSSLGNSISPNGTFDDLKDAATGFLDKFQDGAGGARVGFVAFASGGVLRVPINKNSTRGFNRNTLNNSINDTSNSTGIDPNYYSGIGYTNAEEGMRIAKAELDAIDVNIRSSLRTIVFFSDGAPNVISANFGGSLGSRALLSGYGPLSSSTSSNDFYQYNLLTSSALTTPTSGPNSIPTPTTLPDTDYSGTVNLTGRRALTSPISNTECNANRAARNMVENIANAARTGINNSGITVHTIGLGARLQSLESTGCGYTTATEKGEVIMKRLANTTDSDTYNSNQPAGYYAYAANATQLTSAFDRIASAILRLTK